MKSRSKRCSSLPSRITFQGWLFELQSKDKSQEEQSLSLGILASEYIQKNNSKQFSKYPLNELRTHSEYENELLEMELFKLERCFRFKPATFINTIDTIPYQMLNWFSKKQFLLFFVHRLKEKLKEIEIFDTTCPATIKIRKIKDDPDKDKVVSKVPTFLNKALIKDKTYLKFQYRTFDYITPIISKQAGIYSEEKEFIVIGPYKDIREALLKRGWKENPDPESLRFTLKWTLKTKDLIHDKLHPKQLTNHFFGATEITTKLGLFHNLQNFMWANAGIDINSFHPLTYDLADIEVADFAQQFKIIKAEGLLKLYVESKTPVTMAKVITAIDICERRLCSIKDTMNLIRKKFVSDQEWEILTCHKTMENRLLKKYQILKKRVNKIMKNNLEPLILDKSKRILKQLREKFPQTGINGVRNVWIAKPACSSRGRGITILTDLKRILELQRGRHFIIQKYIENPLIIHKKKFDMRQWVLVTSWNPLEVWMYDEMYLRFGVVDYNTDITYDKFIHLTNNSITKHYTGKASEIKDNMWTNEQFVEYLKDFYGKDIWNKQIKPQIKKIIIISLQSAQEKIIQRTNTFEIFGYDFMIDSELHPWLIEINASPAVDYSTVIS